MSSPTNEWVAFPYANSIVTDPITDHQTGTVEGDLVGGYYGLSAAYTRFYPGGSNTTGTVAFRFRVGGDANPGGFKSSAIVGIDANSDGAFDVFVGVGNSGSDDKVRIWAPSNSALNNSPSTTDMNSQSPLYVYNETTSAPYTNYNWQRVTATTDPLAGAATPVNGRSPYNLDMGSGGGTDHNDYFISFSVPFADLVAALNSRGISGINSSSLMRYVAATATQSNSFNQDINGINAGTTSSSTYDQLFLYTPPVQPNGNRLPVAVNDTASTNEDTTLSNFSVLANDTDADGNTLTVTAASSPNGTVTINGNGTINFTPNSNFHGTTTISYSISDGNGGTASATVTVTVNPINDPPVANNDTANASPGVQTSITNVLANDTDLEGDTLSVVTASVSPVQGTVSVIGNTINFTPAIGYSGTATISYTITDGSSTALAQIAVNVAPNNPPVAVNDTATTSEDTTASNINVLGNDTDADGDTLSVTAASSPNGTVTINPNGTLNFTPAANFNGSTTISYTVSDGRGGTSTGTVNVTVTAVNDAPVAVTDTATTSEDTTASNINVLGNDTDADGDTLSVTAASSPNGTVTINPDGTLNFAPTANFSGSTTISYTISDGNGGTSTGTVNVTVTAMNDAPVAVNDTATTSEDTTASNINVLGNDTDADGDTLTVTAASSLNGTVTINPDGTLNFAPTANFNGSTTISYTVSDGNGGTTTGTVNVTVTAVNDAPVAVTDTATTSEDTTAGNINVLGNDTDADGDTLTVTAASSPNGTVGINADGTLNFNPAANFHGPTTITYTISDGNGGTATGTVTINVAAVNDAPAAGNDTFLATGLTAPYTIPVLGNDTDSDGDTLTILSVTNGSDGTVTINGGSLTYTPGGTYAGTDSFTYTVSDGHGGTATATVQIISTVYVTTLAANTVTPTTATLNADVDPNGVATTLSFEYSTSSTLATFATSGSTSVGSGTGVVAGALGITGLAPNTRYYYRAVSTSSAGVQRGVIRSFLTPMVVWGPSGAPVAAGQLDATRIPNTGVATIYSNVSNQSYDVAITTGDLGGNGHALVTGSSCWWFQGSKPDSAAPAAVSFRFYSTGTTTPHAVSTVRFQIDDAEQMETLLDFAYFDATGNRVPVLWSNSIFTYSHTPSFGSGYASVENGAPYQNHTQSGKWIDVNLTGLSVSGFEFKLQRRTLAAGSVIMGSWGGERAVLGIGGNYTPFYLDSGANGMAALPDYTPQAVITGSATGVTVTQSPAPGSYVPVGKSNVLITARDAEGNQAHTGFDVVVADKTAPVITAPTTTGTGSFGTLPTVMENFESLPDYTAQAITSDNVAVTRITQTPAAGTMVSVGNFPVLLTAYDAAGNSSTYTINITGESSDPTGSAGYDTLAVKGSLVPAAGSGNSIPSNAIFTKFGIPAINDAGAVAYLGYWAKGTTTGRSIFAGKPALPVATQRDAAPGISGATFTVFQDPALNSNSTAPTVAFGARVSGYGISSANDSGIWTNSGGALTLVAREGDVAPGTVNATFRSFAAFTHHSDEVLILGLLGGSAFSSNDTGLWRWTAANGLQLLFREGQLISSPHGQKTVTAFQMLGTVAGSTGHGRHHLDNGYYAARVRCSDSTTCNVFLDATAGTTTVLHFGETRQADATDIASSAIGIPSANPYGSAAFTTTLVTGDSVTAANNGGIVLTQQLPDGSFTNRFVVRKGDSADGTAVWSTFRDPVLNGDDATAWIGRLNGATLATDYAIGFASAGQTPVLIARKGSPAPGTAGVFNNFVSVALPDSSAGPLFTASLAIGPGGVTSGNDVGIWSTDNTGALRLVLREGDVLGGKTIRSFLVLGNVVGSPGQTRSFNAARQIALQITYTDGTQSVTTITNP